MLVEVSINERKETGGLSTLHPPRQRGQGRRAPRPLPCTSARYAGRVVALVGLGAQSSSLSAIKSRARVAAGGSHPHHNLSVTSHHPSAVYAVLYRSHPRQGPGGRLHNTRSPGSNLMHTAAKHRGKLAPKSIPSTTTAGAVPCWTKTHPGRWFAGLSAMQPNLRSVPPPCIFTTATTQHTVTLQERCVEPKKCRVPPAQAPQQATLRSNTSSGCFLVHGSDSAAAKQHFRRLLG